MDYQDIYAELISLEHSLQDLARRITDHPGQQIVLQAIRSADGSDVSARAQVTIPGCADPYMHDTLLDGTERLTWKGGYLRPEQFRPGSVPAGHDDSAWIRMQKEHVKNR